jgi:hypothetical protein
MRKPEAATPSIRLLLLGAGSIGLPPVGLTFTGTCSKMLSLAKTHFPDKSLDKAVTQKTSINATLEVIQ